jgi:hypothetical protein
MDEVYGYFPPTANPPSKKPMLTLLKQARAFGLGCILATQNPVDLDYKGLSNAGTWFLGRLQTERDKMRVLEGLEGASNQAGTAFDRGKMERTLAGLGSRVFLMNNVHEDAPVVFETRWVMSYLRGPLTRNQLQELMKADPNYDAAAIAEAQTPRRPEQQPAESLETTVDPRQLIPPDVPQFFIEPKRRLAGGERLVYRPKLLGRGRLHFVKSTYGVDQWEDRIFVATVAGGELPNEVWETAQHWTERLVWEVDPRQGGEFAKVSDDLQRQQNYKIWAKELKGFLYREQKLAIWKCPELKKYSQAGESLGDFKVRLEQDVSEQRDRETEALRKKYGVRFSALRTKLRKAEDRVEREEGQYSQSWWKSFFSVGSIVAAVFGRKSITTTSTRRTESSFTQSSKEKSDVNRAQDNLDELQIQFEDLEHDFNDAIAQLGEKLSVDNFDYQDLEVTPRKSDISVEEMAVLWLPWKIDSNGIAETIY